VWVVLLYLNINEFCQFLHNIKINVEIVMKINKGD
jgi:hypothetical protein